MHSRTQTCVLKRESKEKILIRGINSLQFRLFSKTRKQDTQKLNHTLLKEVIHDMRKLVLTIIFFYEN